MVVTNYALFIASLWCKNIFWDAMGLASFCYPALYRPSYEEFSLVLHKDQAVFRENLIPLTLSPTSCKNEFLQAPGLCSRSIGNHNEVFRARPKSVYIQYAQHLLILSLYFIRCGGMVGNEFSLFGI